MPSESLNGLAVLSYSVEIDNDLSGNFNPLVGYASDSLSLSYSYIVQGLIKSHTYGLRYRAKNQYGWSDYSPISYLLVATASSQPQRP